MDELQLKMCDIQGRLFELSVDRNLNSATFVKTFMKSNTAKFLDSKYNSMQWMGEEYLLEEIIENAGNLSAEEGQVLPRNILYWSGYLYRYWHYCADESSARIYKQAPVETMVRNYLIFHTMDPALAIEKLKEISDQKR
jgi:hypothetical protein